MDSNGNTTNRSTKGASKQRRDQINQEIQRMRDYLPLSESVKDRLFQLQIMSLACIFIRKHRYLPHILGDPYMNLVGGGNTTPLYPLLTGGGHGVNGGGFYPRRRWFPVAGDLKPCEALRGFLLMVTRQGKMLFISDNACEYLGHSVEEIMSQGDSIYDLVDPRDHAAVQSELLSGPPSVATAANGGRFVGGVDERVFICRMNLARGAKRQLQYHKFVMVEGRYLHPAEYYQALLTITAPGILIHPVFAAYCQPLINPENAENLASGSTSLFRSLHLMDMRFVHIDDIGVFHLGRKSSELEGTSWYGLVHPNDVKEVSSKHRLLCQEKEGSVILLMRLQAATGTWLWVHVVLAIRGSASSASNSPSGLSSVTPTNPGEGQPTQDTTSIGTRRTAVRQLIQATYQLLSDLQAATLQANSWIYSVRYRYSDYASHSSPTPNGLPPSLLADELLPQSRLYRSVKTESSNEETTGVIDSRKSSTESGCSIHNLEEADGEQQICVTTATTDPLTLEQISDMALSALLTPDDSPANSSGCSSAGSAGLGQSTSALTLNGIVGGVRRPTRAPICDSLLGSVELCRGGNGTSGDTASVDVVGRALPEIEPTALESYLREMEAGTLFEHAPPTISGVSGGDGARSAKQSPTDGKAGAHHHHPGLTRHLSLQQNFGGEPAAPPLTIDGIRSPQNGHNQHLSQSWTAATASEQASLVIGNGQVYLKQSCAKAARRLGSWTGD